MVGVGCCSDAVPLPPLFTNMNQKPKNKAEAKAPYQASPRKWMIFNRFRLKWIVRVPPVDCVGGAKHVACVSDLKEAIKIQDAEFKKMGTTYKKMIKVYKKRVHGRCRFSAKCRDPQFMKRYEDAVEKLDDDDVDKFLKG